MRKTVYVATALIGALMALGADTTANTPSTAKKKSSAKPAAHTTVRKTAGKKGKKGPVRSPAQSRQLAPTPDRYKEIQQALATKGYLPAEQANGQWSDSSMSALKRFQADQNLEASGKINSLSLIALGLGPKHEPGKPGAPGTAAPQQP